MQNYQTLMPDPATELSKLTQKFCIDLDFSELQSDKLVKYLNTDWLFMATLKGCKSCWLQLVSCLLVLLQISSSSAQYMSQFWRKYSSERRPEVFKFKYSTSWAVPRDWICPGSISHPFFSSAQNKDSTCAQPLKVILVGLWGGKKSHLRSRIQNILSQSE